MTYLSLKKLRIVKTLKLRKNDRDGNDEEV